MCSNITDLLVQTNSGGEFGLSKLNRNEKTMASVLALLYGSERFYVKSLMNALGISDKKKDRNAYLVVCARLNALNKLGLLTLGRKKDAGQATLVDAKLNVDVADWMLDVFVQENKALHSTKSEKIAKIIKDFSESAFRGTTQGGEEVFVREADHDAYEVRYAGAIERIIDRENRQTAIEIIPFENLPQSPFETMVSYLGNTDALAKVRVAKSRHVTGSNSLLTLDAFNMESFEMIMDQFKDNSFSTKDACVFISKTKPETSGSAAVGRLATMVRRGYIAIDPIASSPVVNGKKYYRVTPEALRVFGGEA